MAEQIDLYYSKRLIGAEDIAFDSNGTGDIIMHVPHNGKSVALHKINAGHIPLTEETRAIVFGATGVSGIVNVDEAIVALANKIVALESSITA